MEKKLTENTRSCIFYFFFAKYLIRAEKCIIRQSDLRIKIYRFIHCCEKLNSAPQRIHVSKRPMHTYLLFNRVPRRVVGAQDRIQRDARRQKRKRDSTR